jgi:N-acetylglutamate synthase-like GNAT family acetyltransferase
MIKIQEVKEENFKDVVALWNQEYDWLTTSKIKISIDKFRKWHTSRKKSGYAYYIVKYNNNFAGLLFLQRKEKQFLIKALAIKNRYRKYGIGKALVEKAKILSKKMNLSLRTEILLNNIDTINWFFDNGFNIIKFRKRTSDYLMGYN